MSSARNAWISYLGGCAFLSAVRADTDQEEGTGSLMKCRYCAGEEPDKIEEFSTWKGIKGEFLIFKYPDKVGRAYQIFTGRGIGGGIVVCAAWQTQRLTHIKSGIVIEIHDCFEQDDIFFKATGKAPQTTDEIEIFTDFFKQVIREKEARGRKGKLTIEYILDALKHLPDEAGWLEIAEYVTRTLQPKYGDDFDAHPDTLQKILQKAKLNLKTARKIAKPEK